MHTLAPDLVARLQAAIPRFERVAIPYEKSDTATQRHAKWWREMAELCREASRALDASNTLLGRAVNRLEISESDCAHNVDADAAVIVEAASLLAGHNVPKIALTFDEVTRQNVERCKRWHKGGLEDWTIAQWAVATCGELGEACNAIKKLHRVDDDIANISDEGRLLATRAEALAKIGEELADTFIYLNLLALRCGVDLADEVVKKFNATSERYNFPERLVR